LAHESNKLISSGKDNRLCIFSARGGVVTLEKAVEGFDSYARGLDYMNGKILVGLRNGFIIEVNEASEEKRILLASHHEGEAWGLEIVP